MKFLLILLFAVAAHATESETVKGAKKDLDSVKTELNAKLDVAEKKMDELRVQAQAKGSEVQEKSVKEFESTRDQLRTQVNDLKADTKTNWKKLKDHLSSSIDELNHKIQEKLKD